MIAKSGVEKKTFRNSTSPFRVAAAQCKKIWPERLNWPWQASRHCLTVRRFKFILLRIVIGWTIRSSSDFLLHWHTQPDYFWPRFYIVVLGMTFLFFRSHLLFSIFYLDFYFPLLFGLLIPFSIWFFYFPFLFGLFFSFSFLFQFFFSSFSILSQSLILDSSKFFSYLLTCEVYLIEVLEIMV